MFFPVGCLYGTVNLSCDAQFCKMEKRSFSLFPVIADCFKQTDHPLLDKIIGIAPDQKHGIRLFPHEWFVLVQHIIHDCGIPSPKLPQKCFIT